MTTRFVYCLDCPGRVGIDIDCTDQAHEHVVLSATPEGDGTVATSGATGSPRTDEVERLCGLLEELLPLLVAEVHFGLALGPAPDDHPADGCDDCAAYEEARVWYLRLESGELGTNGAAAAAEIAEKFPDDVPSAD